ncbi:MAG: amidohydrolase family protein [Terriglobales bacterium]
MRKFNPCVAESTAGRARWIQKSRCIEIPFGCRTSRTQLCSPAAANRRRPLITDCHVHIEPIEIMKPHALAVIKGKRANFDEIAGYSRSPAAFLKYLDRCGIDRAALINYVAPEVMGLTAEVNQFVADYVKHDPTRLLSCGSLHPRHTTNIMADVEHILRLGLRMIKIHPPHQLLYPNDYLNGVKELEIIYRAAEANGIPVMFHTGTSIFPGARNKYGDPIYIDDVAVDFPKLKIILAHGGRPLWMQTAFFLIRRHPNVYLDISSIPPKSLLQYFPRLDEIAHKTLFGTDWPSPGVTGIKQNLEEFKALPISVESQTHILSKTAATLWPE